MRDLGRGFMDKLVRAVSRATWWQVGLLVALAAVSFLDQTPPRVVGGAVLLGLAILIVGCKFLARSGGEQRPGV